MDERVKKYIFRIGSIVLLILICMFIILEIQIKKEHNENLEETSARAVNDIQENTITEKVPQTFDNIQDYILLLFFGILTFVSSILYYSKQKSKSSM